MQSNKEKHTAIFRRDSKVLCICECSTLKKIAVLCFHTAKVDYIEPITKVEFKRIRNRVSEKSMQCSKPNNIVGHTFGLNSLYLPVPLQDVSNPSN